MLQLSFAALCWSSNNTVLQCFPAAVPRELLSTRRNAIVQSLTIRLWRAKRIILGGNCSKQNLPWVAIIPEVAFDQVAVVLVPYSKF